MTDKQKSFMAGFVVWAMLAFVVMMCISGNGWAAFGFGFAAWNALGAWTEMRNKPEPPRRRRLHYVPLIFLALSCVAGAQDYNVAAYYPYSINTKDSAGITKVWIGDAFWCWLPRERGETVRQTGDRVRDLALRNGNTSTGLNPDVRRAERFNICPDTVFYAPSGKVLRYTNHCPQCGTRIILDGKNEEVPDWRCHVTVKYGCPVCGSETIDAVDWRDEWIGCGNEIGVFPVRIVHVCASCGCVYYGRRRP